MSSVLDTITAYLSGKGLTKAQVAGVEGNLYVESGFNPAAANAKEGAIGLAQWEGGRRTSLQQFAAGRGTSETDLATQLEFMWSELVGPERSALTSLYGASTPTAAATVFDTQYERSAGTSRQGRIDAANDLYTGVALPGNASSFAGVSTSATGTADESLLDKINPFSNWAADALGIGLKLAGTGAALALVVAGVMYTVKEGQS